MSVAPSRNPLPTPIDRALYRMSTDAAGWGLPAWALRRLWRIVLEEAREPDEALVKAAAETPGMQAVDSCVVMAYVHGSVIGDEHMPPNSPLQQAWRAMIDKLLEDGAP